MGAPDQPHYLNAVAGLDTMLAPLELLRELQRIESEQGRTRDGRRWQARTLDLDLLLHGERRVRGPSLTLPHPGVHCRAFVIHPLAEIAPLAVVPGLGRVRELADAVPGDELERVPGWCWDA
jgi:2-amino-4-hydroxy-6-hydroxymethyldihydropteridine diphosphokinase